MDREAIISSQEWELHKDVIYEFYINQDLKLKDVRQQMHDWFAFTASESQYKRKLKQWGFEKYQKQSRWQAIGRCLKQRRLDHTSADIRVGVRQLSPGKLQRGLRRHVLPSLQQSNHLVSRPLTPNGVCIRRALPNPNALSSSALPGFQLLERIRSMLLSHSGPSQHFTDAIEVSTVQGPGRVHTGSEDWQLATNPGPFPNVEVPYSIPDLFISRWRLLDGTTALAYRPSGLDHTPSDTTSSVLGDLIRLIIPDPRDKARLPRLLAVFPAHDSDHLPADLDSRLCTPGLVGNLALIGCVIYLCSNHLLEERKFDTIMESFLQTGNTFSLESFGRMESTSLRNFAECLLIYAAKNDRHDLLGILKRYGVDLDRPVHAYLPIRTALQEAIIHRNKAFCKILIEEGADVKTQQFQDSDEPYGQPPIELAATYLPETFRFILERTPEIDFNQFFPNVVCSGVDIDTVRGLLQRGADINTIDGSFRTALHYAIKNEDVVMVQFLLDHGAYTEGTSTEVLEKALVSIDDPTDFSSKEKVLLRVPTPLQQAVEVGSVEICEMLLKSGAEVNSTPFERSLRLLQDCEPYGRRHPDYTLPLSTDSLHSAKFDPLLHCLFPVLVFAAWECDVKMVKLLLHYGADVHQMSCGQWQSDALKAASWKGNIEVMSLLIDAGADINATLMGPKGRTALQCAAERGHTAATMFLLERGADINAPCAENGGRTALQAAAEGGHEQLVDILLRAGADVNACPAHVNGVTALAAAIDSKCDSLFWRVIEAGADPAIVESEGRVDYDSPFMIAIRNGSASIARTLLDLGLNINTPLSSGYSLAEQALLCLSRNAKEMLDLILEVGIFGDASVFTSALLQYVYVVVRQPYKTDYWVIQQLLDRGADTNLRRRHGESVLEEACKVGDLKLVRYLVQRGADVNLPAGPKYGFTALQAASFYGHIDVVEFLLGRGADVNAPAGGRYGLTALQAAAMQGCVRIAQLLIAAGADVGAPPSPYRSQTAIKGAAEFGRLDMVKLLLDNYQIKEGESLSDICAEAAEVARKECHWAIVDLLENYQRESNSSP
ncbi:hypothetical protein A1O3_04229 [Capronia epimyces CBS 606.96]|uniref:Clr5 domain-containing protein n=1 Tax=Capronia epimyces CBS 606.96 TaxID=1182542 RepID=W9YC66_9EURO|nr:uncharacterized protein A1O3_04229 [Capronia epimyces CBS 606.96]EXJ87270.1 hypothetical protein A1O3_04229 [Capronia epimyces CBS 606.96]